MNVPTAPYRPVAPTARDAAPYLGWLVDRAVRVGRDSGYGNIVDQGLALILRDLGVVAPAGGFVDSDGRNARGVRNDGFGADGFNADGFNRQGFDKEGFNVDGLNRAGQTRDEVIEDEVDGWTAEKAAAVMTALAGRIG